MSKSSAKRSLITSILLLVVALFTCVGVSLAYFTANDSGTNNVVDIGRFVFNTSSTLSATVRQGFKDPTVLNADIISKPQKDDADYAARLALYNSNGDDEHFNDMCVMFTATVENDSETVMDISCDLAFSYADGTDVNGEFLYYAFDSAAAIPDYAAAIRTSALAASADYVRTGVPLDDTVAMLNNGLAALSVSLEPGTSGAYTFVCWIDWRLYSAVTPRPNGAVKITLSLTAANAVA